MDTLNKVVNHYNVVLNSGLHTLTEDVASINKLQKHIEDDTRQFFNTFPQAEQNLVKIEYNHLINGLLNTWKPIAVNFVDKITDGVHLEGSRLKSITDRDTEIAFLKDEIARLNSEEALQESNNTESLKQQKVLHDLEVDELKANHVKDTADLQILLDALQAEKLVKDNEIAATKSSLKVALDQVEQNNLGNQSKMDALKLNLNGQIQKLQEALAAEASKSTLSDQAAKSSLLAAGKSRDDYKNQLKTAQDQVINNNLANQSNLEAVRLELNGQIQKLQSDLNAASNQSNQHSGGNCSRGGGHHGPGHHHEGGHRGPGHRHGGGGHCGPH